MTETLESKTTPKPLGEQKIRVLSVDDHEFLSEGLRARLALEPDMELVGNLTSADALIEEVRRLEVDVVLLDVEMRGTDPFEAVVALKQVEPHCRVIMLSAYVRDYYVDASVKAEAWGYLSKSDSPASIVEAVRSVYKGRFTVSPIVMERCRRLGGSSADTSEDHRPQQDHPEHAARVSRLGALTPREVQVLRMIGKGLSRREIALAIFRSPKTVDTHRASIMEKLAIRDRVELARFALREGLAEP